MVNGPYALITTAVSADLGTHKSLKGNSKALATVTAIIDGTGSIGRLLVQAEFFISNFAESICSVTIGPDKGTFLHKIDIIFLAFSLNI